MTTKINNSDILYFIDTLLDNNDSYMWRRTCRMTWLSVPLRDIPTVWDMQVHANKHNNPSILEWISYSYDIITGDVSFGIVAETSDKKDILKWYISRGMSPSDIIQYIPNNKPLTTYMLLCKLGGTLSMHIAAKIAHYYSTDWLCTMAWEVPQYSQWRAEDHNDYIGIVIDILIKHRVNMLKRVLEIRVPDMNGKPISVYIIARLMPVWYRCVEWLNDNDPTREPFPFKKILLLGCGGMALVKVLHVLHIWLRTIPK